MGFKFSSTLLFSRLSYKFRVISEKIINDSNQKRICTKWQYKSSMRRVSTLCQRTSHERRAGCEPTVILALYLYVHTQTLARCSLSHFNQNSFDSFVHVWR